MKQLTYQTKGVCSRAVRVELDDNDVVTSVAFDGGCSGNTQGVARLAVGRPAQEVIGLVAGIRCGTKPTSCPDQLSVALGQALRQR